MLIDAIGSYLSVRRAMGFELRETERLLRRFAAFATTRGDTHVRTQTAIEWASGARSSGESYYRLRRVVIFARHARAEDPQHEVPPDGVFCRSPRQITPHIYTPEEAQRIVNESARLGPPGSLRAPTFTALFALLFATGLRISEALGLHFEDITNDGLVIRRTKFRKTRLVPLHESAQAGMQRYLAVRRAHGGTSDHVFVNGRGRPLRYAAVHSTFRELRQTCDLLRPGRPAPRIHDTRHTFAARALETSPDGRDRIAEHSLALSTYLGHTRVSDTYWYLQATPQLMRDIADACHRWLDGETP